MILNQAVLISGFMLFIIFVTCFIEYKITVKNTRKMKNNYRFIKVYNKYGIFKGQNNDK